MSMMIPAIIAVLAQETQLLIFNRYSSLGHNLKPYLMIGKGAIMSRTWIPSISQNVVLQMRLETWILD